MSQNNKSIALACDHAAVAFKDSLITFLNAQNITTLDLGTNNNDSTDYPDYAKKAVDAISSGKSDLAILCCGSGIGMSIKANRYPNIRAAVVWDEESATLAKQHNNANVLCLGARFLESEQAKKMLSAWLNAEFETRHQRRLDKLT
eukprot:COSAG01_NODE_8762_length_2667_cov_39.151121_2_plen_146_part_00